MTPILPQISLC